MVGHELQRSAGRGRGGLRGRRRHALRPVGPTIRIYSHDKFDRPVPVHEPASGHLHAGVHPANGQGAHQGAGRGQLRHRQQPRSRYPQGHFHPCPGCERHRCGRGSNRRDGEGSGVGRLEQTAFRTRRAGSRWCGRSTEDRAGVVVAGTITSGAGCTSSTTSCPPTTPWQSSALDSASRTRVPTTRRTATSVRQTDSGDLGPLRADRQHRRRHSAVAATSAAATASTTPAAATSHLPPPSPPPPPPATASIGNRVWLDANHNGIQDGGEQGLAEYVTLQDTVHGSRDHFH